MRATPIVLAIVASAAPGACAGERDGPGPPPMTRVVAALSAAASWARDECRQLRGVPLVSVVEAAGALTVRAVCVHAPRLSVVPLALIDGVDGDDSDNQR